MPRSRPYSQNLAIFHRRSVDRDATATSPLVENRIDREWSLLRARKLREELSSLVESELDLELAIRRGEGEPVRTTAELLNLDPSTVTRRGERALRTIHSAIVAKLVCALLNRTGSATMTLTEPRPIDPHRDAFAVSIGRHNQFFGCIVTWQLVDEWIRKNWTVLHCPTECNHDELRIRYIWGRYHEGRTELSITRIIRDEFTARQVALEHGQNTIYHMATGRTLAVQ